MAVMHTTMIRASMTAYSTAVGPSSFFRNFTRACPNLRMVWVLCQFTSIFRSVRGRPEDISDQVHPAETVDEIHQPLAAAFNDTLLNVPLALVPSVVMAAMQTTMI